LPVKEGFDEGLIRFADSVWSLKVLRGGEGAKFVWREGGGNVQHVILKFGLGRECLNVQEAGGTLVMWWFPMYKTWWVQRP
jgi:hypothetical protein